MTKKRFTVANTVNCAISASLAAEARRGNTTPGYFAEIRRLIARTVATKDES